MHPERYLDLLAKQTFLTMLAESMHYRLLRVIGNICCVG